MCQIMLFFYNIFWSGVVPLCFPPDKKYIQINTVAVLISCSNKLKTFIKRVFLFPSSFNLWLPCHLVVACPQPCFLYFTAEIKPRPGIIIISGVTTGPTKTTGGVWIEMSTPLSLYLRKNCPKPWVACVRASIHGSVKSPIVHELNCWVFLYHTLPDFVKPTGMKLSQTFESKTMSTSPLSSSSSSFCEGTT